MLARGRYAKSEDLGDGPSDSAGTASTSSGAHREVVGRVTGGPLRLA